MPIERVRRAFLDRLPIMERTEILSVLRDETTGGFVLLVATAVALLWANLGADSYQTAAGTVIGPAALHLDLTVATWGADGLLAVFFLVAGLELKRETVLGELSDRATAILPAIAAVCGMVVPALVYLTVNLAMDGALTGWAVPTATDIAFALAVLAVIGSRLPTSLRAFLLTLAVVDDLLAITIIAVFFTRTCRRCLLSGPSGCSACTSLAAAPGHRLVDLPADLSGRLGTNPRERRARHGDRGRVRSGDPGPPGRRRTRVAGRTARAPAATIVRSRVCPVLRLVRSGCRGVGGHHAKRC